MPMSMPEFIERFEGSINETIVQLFPPVYNAETRKACGFDLRRLGRRPLGAQGDAIRAAALSLQANPCTNIVGEMGTGKSNVAAAAAYLAGCRSVLLLCPPHLYQFPSLRLASPVRCRSSTILCATTLA
jgi:hypothetical protein